MTNPFAQSNPFSPMQTQANPFAGSQAPQAANPFAPQAPQGFQQPQFGAPAPGQFPAPQPVQLQPFMVQGMGSANDATDRTPPLPDGGHEDIEVGEIKIENSTKPGNQGVVYFKAEMIVRQSSLVPAGTTAWLIEKLTGHKYPNRQMEAYARIRAFVAGCLGQEGDSPEVRAMFDNVDPQTGMPGSMKILQGCQQGALKGKHCTIRNGKTKHFAANPPQYPKATSITEYRCGPLGSQVSAAPPVQAAAPVAQFQAPAQGFGGPVFPPAGWQADGTGHYTGYANGQLHRVSENDLRSAVAAGKV